MPTFVRSFVRSFVRFLFFVHRSIVGVWLDCNFDAFEFTVKKEEKRNLNKCRTEEDKYSAD